MGILTFLESIRAAKADDASLKLHNEFYDKSHHPLDTRTKVDIELSTRVD